MNLEDIKKELETLESRRIEIFELNDSGELESYEYNSIIKDIEMQIRKLKADIKRKESQ